MDYERGAFELNPKTQQAELVWPQPLCHAHRDRRRELWCADQSPYYWHERPVEVMAYNRVTSQVRHIVTAMPEPPNVGAGYHMDPHPQFSLQDSGIVYTTMVRGQVDVAVCPTAGIGL